MKKIRIVEIIIIFIMLIGIFGTVFATETINIDLETAVKMALENDLELKKARVELEKSKLEYQKNVASNLSNVSRYKELQVEISLKSAEDTYQRTEYQLILDTLNQYTDLWLADYDLKIKEKQLGLEKRLVEEARAQYEIGDIGVVDLLEKENDYNDVELSLSTSHNDYQQGIREFKNNLNLVHEEVVLADLNYAEIWQITEDKVIETALENSLNIILAKKELELAEIDLERAAISSAELDRNIKEKTVESARLEKESTTNDLKSNVQSDYYQLQELDEKIALTRERLAEAKKKYNLRKKQYDVGLLTVTEVMEYEVSMMNAKYDYLSAIANYYVEEQILHQQMNLRFGGLIDEVSRDE